MSVLARILISFWFVLYLPDSRDSPSTYFQPASFESQADCEKIKEQLLEFSGRKAKATDCYESVMQMIDLTPRPKEVPTPEPSTPAQ